MLSQSNDCCLLESVFSVYNIFNFVFDVQHKRFNWFSRPLKLPKPTWPNLLRPLWYLWPQLNYNSHIHWINEIVVKFISFICIRVFLPYKNKTTKTQVYIHSKKFCSYHKKIKFTVTTSRLFVLKLIFVILNFNYSCFKKNYNVNILTVV